MKPVPLFLLIVSLLLLFRAIEGRAGRLADIEETVRTAPSHSGGWHPDDDDDYYDPLVGPFFYGRSYYPYPYYHRYRPQSEERMVTRTFSFSGGLHYLYDIDGDLEGYRGDVRVGTPVGKLGADFTRFREDLNPGHDYLNLYYLDYSFGFDLPEFSFDFGFGYSGLQGHKTYNGGNIFLAVEAWPLHPLGVDLMVKASTIHDSNVYDYRIGINLVYRRFGLRLGYRYLDFEGNNDIRGPEAGVTVRF